MTRAGRAMVGTLAVVVALALSACGKSVTSGGASGGGSAAPQGVALIKGAQHPAAAWLFSDWMLSDGQKLLVSLGLTPSVKIAGDNSLQGVTLEPYDVQGLTQDSKTWDDRYDQLLRGLEQIGGD